MPNRMNRFFICLRRKILCALGWHDWMDDKPTDLYNGGVYMGSRCAYCHKNRLNNRWFEWGDLVFIIGILAVFGYLVWQLFRMWL